MKRKRKIVKKSLTRGGGLTWSKAQKKGKCFPAFAPNQGPNKGTKNGKGTCPMVKVKQFDGRGKGHAKRPGRGEAREGVQMKMPPLKKKGEQTQNKPCPGRRH